MHECIASSEATTSSMLVRLKEHRLCPDNITISTAMYAIDDDTVQDTHFFIDEIRYNGKHISVDLEKAASYPVTTAKEARMLKIHFSKFAHEQW
mmetsp:Transcript_5712/g.10318  ORF Transcript_5712/g.10318 Transcript_5712/m.10318 type:complete len:94 (-) Transcript_5712:814-1095(-)